MTKKLKLNVESLCVDSFETAGERVERGTVQGHDGTQYADSCGCAPRPSDGCSIGCPDSSGCPEPSNNCWTVISF